mmetsp:Transcript_100194/g.139229  ORF Transcript_100194/g.139229 Transcript_100194/m.139229 type:complete len:143 (+) Transcript_100194:35-463(+)|eukprot:s574_g12.t1
MATDSAQIEAWADEVFAAAGKETTWSVSEVRCLEEGCPPVETVLTDLGVKEPKPGNGVYKVFKPIADVQKEDIQQALMSSQSHGHGGHGGHGDDSHSAHAGHGGDSHCCDGHDGHKGHGHGHGHEDSGHAAHGAAHSHGSHE